MCSLSNVFSIECVLYVSMQTTEGVLHRMCSLNISKFMCSLNISKFFDPVILRNQCTDYRRCIECVL